MSGSGISWDICKSAAHSRQITMPAPHHSVFYRPDALPAAQPTALKHWRHSSVPHRPLKTCSFKIQHCEGPQSLQEAQLSPRDRAMRRVNLNLANCDATVQKLLMRQVLTKSMVWSWRFSRRQCVIDNVHSTMTPSSRLPLSQVS